MVTATEKLLTVIDFAKLSAPADGSRQELKKGVVLTMPPPGFRHGKVVFHLAKKLDQFVSTNGLGQVIPETGMVTERSPDSVRGPDVSFWSVERLPLDHEPDPYPDVAADLCVEVLSPGETLRSIHEKVVEYFDADVRMVWIVDPENRTVTVYRSAERGQVLHEEATILGEDVLPDFSCRVAELFPGNVAPEASDQEQS